MNAGGHMEIVDQNNSINEKAEAAGHVGVLIIEVVNYTFLISFF